MGLGKSELLSPLAREWRDSRYRTVTVVKGGEKREGICGIRSREEVARPRRIACVNVERRGCKK